MRRRPPGRVRLLGEVLATLGVDETHGLTWLSMDAGALEKYDVRQEDLDGIVEHARSIAGTRMALFFRDLGYGKVKVSFRSTGEVDVNAFARQFGGGGHAKASGALIAGSLERGPRARASPPRANSLGREPASAAARVVLETSLAIHGMATPLQARIAEALARVRHPRTGKDVVQSDAVRDVATTTTGNVRLTLLLAPGDDPALARTVRQAVEQRRGRDRRDGRRRRRRIERRAPRDKAAGRTLPVMDTARAPAARPRADAGRLSEPRQASSRSRAARAASASPPSR